jgi:hypothetical protein
MKRLAYYEHAFRNNGWRLVIFSRGARTYIRLHWKDKDDPTHESEVSTESIISMLEDLKKGMEDEELLLPLTRRP